MDFAGVQASPAWSVSSWTGLARETPVHSDYSRRRRPGKETCRQSELFMNGLE